MYYYLMIISLLITACATQERAKIDLKGEQSYDWKNDLLASNINEEELFNNDLKIVFVEPGDTLYSIATKHNVLYRELADKNNLIWPYNLYTGQKLIIPQVKTHRVEAGETLLSISRKYNISIEDIITLNDLNKPYIVKPGQVIRINKSDKTNQSPEVISAPITDNFLPPSSSELPLKLPNDELQQPKLSKQSSALEKSENYIMPKSKKIVLDEELPIKQNTEKSHQIKIINSKIKFNWPVNGNIISNFGPKVGGIKNDGINISVQEGTPVKAAHQGKIIYAGNELTRYGNLMIIKHDNGWFTAYAHMSDIIGKKGDVIKASQVIGHVGKTGNVNNPQLHFALRNGKTPVNPISFLPKKITNN